MKWIGITGGIGTGKSTVSQCLRDLGFQVIDADKISWQITQKGEAGYNFIVNTFGQELLSEEGEINRKKLAKIVFSDPEKLKKLEKGLHPLIQQKVAEEKERRKTEKAVFYDVPLLYEKKLQNQFDQVWLVTASKKDQLTRLEEHRGMSAEEAQERINSQMSLEEKEKLADVVICNQGDLAELKEKVVRLIKSQKI